MSEHRLDILISRILDRIETPEEWSEFRAIAAAEPSAWELLAEAQRDNDRLARLARDATEFAVTSPLPAVEQPLRLPAAMVRRPMSAAAGWAAAAVLLLSWIAIGPAAGRREPSDIQTAGLSPTPSVDEALQDYLKRGQADGVVLGEVEPKMLIDSRPLEGGAVEVIFVRQILERRQVPTLVRVDGVDDEGNLRASVVRPTIRGEL